MMKTRHKRARKSAFTLIEVLMVAAILALLAAFAVPALMKQGTRARNDLCKAAVGRNGIIAKALLNYQFDVGTIPDSDDGLRALFEIPSGLDEDDKIWNGPYLLGPYEELQDPWQREFHYKSPGEFNEDGYDLWSTGEDRKDGTEDDIKNWTER